MYIRASKWAVVKGCPFTLINGLGDTQIESQLRYDPPAERDIRPPADAVDRRNRKSIENVVLIGIDTIVPVPSVKPLEPCPDG